MRTRTSLCSSRWATGRRLRCAGSRPTRYSRSTASPCASGTPGSTPRTATNARRKAARSTGSNARCSSKATNSRTRSARACLKSPTAARCTGRFTRRCKSSAASGTEVRRRRGGRTGARTDDWIAVQHIAVVGAIEEQRDGDQRGWIPGRADRHLRPGGGPQRGHVNGAYGSQLAVGRLATASHGPLRTEYPIETGALTSRPVSASTSATPRARAAAPCPRLRRGA